MLSGWKTLSTKNSSLLEEEEEEEEEEELDAYLKVG